MKYFKIAYNMIIKRFLFTLLIIIEISALLILSNTVIASYNSKNMLYKPYKDILRNDGIMLFVTPIDRDLTPQDVLKTVSEKNLEGDINIYHTDSLGFIKSYGPKSTLYGEKDYNINYYLIDEEIFNKFRLPLSEGKWASPEKNSAGEIEIVISGGTDAKLNDVYDTPVGKLRVTGILTENTYTPPSDNISRYRNNEIDGKDSLFTYYNPFDSNVNMGGAFAVANKSLFPKDSTEEYNIIVNSIWFVSYGKGFSDEAIKRNTEYLKSFNDHYEDEIQYFSTVDQASRKVIDNIYIRMFPIVISALIVVLSGLIGSVSISAIKQMKTFGIFFLCGCRWKDCIKIISANLAIIFLISFVFTAIGIFVFNAFNFEYLIGLTFDYNNIIISTIMLVFMYLLSIILPYNIIKTSSPIETIKENL